MKINLEKAKKLYPESPEWFKEELAKQFGLKKLCDWKAIRTFEDACEHLGVDVPVFESLTTDVIAYLKLKIIIKAVNEGWVPDWNNKAQKKWSPWFVLSSGFGFAHSIYRYDLTGANVGSRLCFESEEKSTYVAKQFLEIYEDFLK